MELYRLVLRASLRFNSCFSPRARNLLVKVFFDTLLETVHSSSFLFVSVQLINKNPSERLGSKDPADVKNHPFFSQTEISADEERHYASLEDERLKQQEAAERASRISMPALSRATKRLSMSLILCSVHAYIIVCVCTCVCVFVYMRERVCVLTLHVHIIIVV